MYLPNLAAPIGWGPTGSRALANNGVPGVGFSTPYEAVYSRETTVFIPDSLKLYCRYRIYKWMSFGSGDGNRHERLFFPGGWDRIPPGRHWVHRRRREIHWYMISSSGEEAACVRVLNPTSRLVLVSHYNTCREGGLTMQQPVHSCSRSSCRVHPPGPPLPVLLGGNNHPGHVSAVSRESQDGSGLGFAPNNVLKSRGARNAVRI